MNLAKQNKANKPVVFVEGLRPRFLHINGQWADHRSFALTSEEVPQGVLDRWLRRR